MSIVSAVKGWFGTTEADVMAMMMKVWQEIPVAEKEVASAANWIATKGLPSLTAEVQAITPFVSVLGTAAGHPELAANMAALNIAMAGVQSFAASASAGAMTPDQVVAGYGALKQAGSAAQQVVSTAAAIVAITPVSKPAA